jgi:hypothetical protein
MINRTASPPVCRILVAATLLTVCCVVSGAVPSAAQFAKLAPADKGVNYRMFKDPGGRFEFEYPTKDWRELSSAATLAIIARNDGATVAIDLSRMALARPLTAEAFDTLAEVEIDGLKERHPQAKDFKFELIETKGGRGVLIRYASLGTKGPERVIQYTMPVGLDLYRVIAVVPEMLLSKHEPVLLHMIQSFQMTTRSTNPKD